MHFAGKTRIATLFKDQFSHAYLSVTTEQFHFAFGVSLLVLNHIKTVFTHLFTNLRHIMKYKFKQTNASESVLILDEGFCSQ
jgi:ppGpp synthetase/RelA/SpoT-type nucleotidyltranferase